MRRMIRLSSILCLAIAIAGCAAPAGPAVRLEKANVLPVAIDDSFQFRKIKQSLLNYSVVPPVTTSEAAIFERERGRWGAITGFEVTRRNGNYYDFFWHNANVSDVTLRLEYRQADLGNHVMAQELFYPAARGSHKSSFQVAGDEFLENGRVTAWRALLIVDGRIVALRQSFVWR